MFFYIKVFTYVLYHYYLCIFVLVLDVLLKPFFHKKKGTSIFRKNLVLFFFEKTASEEHLFGICLKVHITTICWHILSLTILLQVRGCVPLPSWIVTYNIPLDFQVQELLHRKTCCVLIHFLRVLCSQHQQQS